MQSPQNSILMHYLRGGSLTVITAREKYHTTELRRVNSRLNQALRINGYEIRGKKLDGDKFKTYFYTKM